MPGARLAVQNRLGDRRHRVELSVLRVQIHGTQSALKTSQSVKMTPQLDHPTMFDSVIGRLTRPPAVVEKKLRAPILIVLLLDQPVSGILEKEPCNPTIEKTDEYRLWVTKVFGSSASHLLYLH